MMYLSHDYHSYRDNKCIKVKQNFSSCSTKKIDFDIHQCYNKANFNQKIYHGECGNLFDTPQLYRCFGKDYAQVLNYIVRFVNEQPILLYEIKNLNPNCSELNYNRVCYYKQNTLLYTTQKEIYTITFDWQKQRNNTQLPMYQKNKIYEDQEADFMLFSYQNQIVVFDINSQTLYSVEDINNFKLVKICQTEAFQVIFQNKYLILSDMNEPTPTIFIYDFTNKKYVEQKQNFFQDSFFDYLTIDKRCELEIDEQCQQIIDQMFTTNKQLKV